MKQLILIKIFLLMGIGIVTAQKSKSLFPQMPGMVTFTYRNSFQKDMAATLDTIKSLGITDMEFSNLFDKTPAEIRKLLDERGMYCSSFGVSYSDALNKTKDVGQNAKILGATYVRVASIPFQAPFNLIDAKKTVQDFDKIGKQLKEEFGLIFCYHNHGFEFQPYEDGTLFDYIVQKTKPKYVSFELDILWAFFPGYDPVALLIKYGKRFKLIHLKDLRTGIQGNLSGGTAKENDVAIGTGQLNIPAILKAARRAGIKHYYIEDESPSYYKQVPQSINYLKELKH